MANQETQFLDDIVASGRRKMLTLGLTSLAGAALGALAPSAKAAAYTDADILNFALNLEYLEANFYYMAAFGTTIDVANSASTAAGAPLITLSGTVGTAGTVSLLTESSNLAVAAGILAVEAYHAGLIRTTINYLDPTGANIGGYTNLISTLRASLSLAASPTTLSGAAANPYDDKPDDYGLATANVSLGGGTSVTATRITDADPTSVIAFARDTTQVLNIVTGGGAVNGTNVVSPAVGIFFPAGLNAGPNGFK